MNPNPVGQQSQEILVGSVAIQDLAESSHSIGTMNTVCKHCGALKFKAETKGSCCGDGKVTLPLFPKPSPEILELWLTDSQEGKFFRQHARSINNAVSLSSIRINERRMPGFNPSLIIAGQVQHRMGSLLPEDGQIPRYAQLYVHDPSLESLTR